MEQRVDEQSVRFELGAHPSGFGVVVEDQQRATDAVDLGGQLVGAHGVERGERHHDSLARIAETEERRDGTTDHLHRTLSARTGDVDSFTEIEIVGRHRLVGHGDLLHADRCPPLEQHEMRRAGDSVDADHGDLRRRLAHRRQIDLTVACHVGGGHPGVGGEPADPRVVVEVDPDPQRPRLAETLGLAQQSVEIGGHECRPHDKGHHCRHRDERWRDREALLPGATIEPKRAPVAAGGRRRMASTSAAIRLRRAGAGARWARAHRTAAVPTRSPATSTPATPVTA